MAKNRSTDLKTIIEFWLVPLGIGLVLLFIYAAKVGLMMVGISVFLALALKPLVNKVNRFFNKIFGAKKKFSTVSAILAYLIVVLAIVGIVAVIGPVVVNETTRFVQKFPETFEKTVGGWDGVNNFGKSIGIENLQGEINNAVANLSKQLLGILGPDLFSGVSGVADTITKILLTLILTMLVLLDGPKLLSSFWNRLAKDEDNQAVVQASRRTVSKMGNVVSVYVSRQVLIAVADGCASALIVFMLSLFTNISSELAIPMGLITMVFYMIPMFGQFIGGSLVTVLLLFTNPIAALVFGIVYIIYAQVENNVLSPRIQGSALHLPPLVILGAVVIGMYAFGFLGAIISVPIAGCIRVLVDEYPNIRAAQKN